MPRQPFIRERLYTINTYLSGVDGKGYDALKDEIGIDPDTFGKLHNSRKRKILEEIFGWVKAAVVNDLEQLKDSITTGERYDIIFEDLERLGLATGAMSWLLDHYGASPLMKDWEVSKE